MLSKNCETPQSKRKYRGKGTDTQVLRVARASGPGVQVRQLRNVIPRRHPLLLLSWELAVYTCPCMDGAWYRKTTLRES